MTAAEWIAAARDSGMSVYSDPRRPACVLISRPVLVPGIAEPEPYHPERWPGLMARLDAIGGAAIKAELAREAA